MMTNDRLMFEAARALRTADRIIQRSWKKGFIRPAGARRLAKEARAVMCCALELENRARGEAAPKIG